MLCCTSEPFKKLNVVLNGEQEKNPLLVCGWDAKR